MQQLSAEFLPNEDITENEKAHFKQSEY